jgi:nucleoid-associated protein YgaU
MIMGIFDFMKKGVEKPVERKPAEPQRPIQPQQPAGTTTSREYVVKSGDSLSKIAKQFYGNASDWQKIFNANKDQIKDPNLIHPGQKIKIP